MSKEKLYAVIDEFEGDCVGTVDEILEWAHDKQIDINRCKAYEVGCEVEMTISFKPKESE